MLLADPIKDSEFDWQLTAIGRLQPFDLLDFKKFEGPLSGKAAGRTLSSRTVPVRSGVSITARATCFGGIHPQPRTAPPKSGPGNWI